MEKITKSDAEWRAELDDLEFKVLRKHGTERAFTGAYWDTKQAGTYACAGCKTPLFRSDEKYASGCGWPSFTGALEESKVTEHRDTTHGMIRTEVRCATCAGHLGHVFPDGPPPRGLRYCINSASLEFQADESVVL